MAIFIDFVIFYFGIDYILDFIVIELDVGELFVVVFEKFILEGRFIVVVVELKFLVIVERLVVIIRFELRDVVIN